MTLNTPGGSFASSRIFAMRSPPVMGVSALGFTTTALPSAKAGAIERMERCSGQFQGLMTPTTPTGMR